MPRDNNNAEQAKRIVDTSYAEQAKRIMERDIVHNVLTRHEPHATEGYVEIDERGHYNPVVTNEF